MTDADLPAATAAANWIRFLRGYGPLANNENLFDEHIRRSAKRNRVRPLEFKHPVREDLDAALLDSTVGAIVLTGTAGDGKTHLCRSLWEAWGGSGQAFEHSDQHLVLPSPDGSRTMQMIKDLSAWVPQRGVGWPDHRLATMRAFCSAVLDDAGSTLFVIAANDGQLIESLRRLETPEGAAVLDRIEELLVSDREQSGALRLYNLSRRSSADLFDRASSALFAHEGWTACREHGQTSADLFGPDCPVRRNFETLSNPTVRQRVRDLLQLCDLCRVHIPVRHILLLLVNALLGYARANKDGPIKEPLLKPEDVRVLVQAGFPGREAASVYSNLLGYNLSETRRRSVQVFDALARFGIGSETSNRIDNVLIYGAHLEHLRDYHRRLLGVDDFYGYTPAFAEQLAQYLDGDVEDDQTRGEFLDALARQRCAMFFRIPDAEAGDLQLWQLTVFHFAGEYLRDVFETLQRGVAVEQRLVARLVRGLNRVFTGMLLTDADQLLLAVSLANTQARLSELLEDRVFLERRGQEGIDIALENGVPVLRVRFSDALTRSFELHLMRFEFLSRVADGALPSSFSKECYEDVLAFKGTLLSDLETLRDQQGTTALSLKLLRLASDGRSYETKLAVHGE